MHLEIIKKTEEGTKDLSFGIEGKSIDWSGKRIGHKNSLPYESSNRSPDRRANVFKADDNYGKGNLKVLEMLKNGRSALQEGRSGHSHLVKQNIDMGQWDLFHKYGNKFGIKPQECNRHFEIRKS